MKKLYRFALLIGTAGIIMFSSASNAAFNNEPDVGFYSDFFDGEDDNTPMEKV